MPHSCGQNKIYEILYRFYDGMGQFLFAALPVETLESELSEPHVGLLAAGGADYRNNLGGGLFRLGLLRLSVLCGQLSDNAASLCAVRVHAHGRFYGLLRRHYVAPPPRGQAKDSQGQQYRSLCGGKYALLRAGIFLFPVHRRDHRD